ncbi:MAG: radical SAM protein [Betaproteobacteria bacterium HGW-Betaproteobacteria-7]|jgi:radical SAM/Cys-rich protein|nr:MAG: radical SAM protein [Betaproteobacteria bacterium HGW-Betaproteobacteria-7]
MLDTLPLLRQTDFPPLRRGRLTTLQANLGYRCNQACLHCHVAASPKRTETMSWATMETLLAFAERHAIRQLDLTGGAPELNPDFRRLVDAARARGIIVIDRCNLTILDEPGQEDLAEFLASLQVEIVASLPCYLEENVNRQRGDGVFAASLAGLRRLNALGYGQPGSGLTLTLVYNPGGPSLPPEQGALEAAYKRELANRYGIVFNQLFVLANMPIKRFGSELLAGGQFHNYMVTLKAAYQAENLPGVMCRSLISVGWRGEVFDCDFNQMLELPLGDTGQPVFLADLLNDDLENRAVHVADHCYGCTAGQGSSCGGALAA